MHHPCEGFLWWANDTLQLLDQMVAVHASAPTRIAQNMRVHPSEQYAVYRILRMYTHYGRHRFLVQDPVPLRCVHWKKEQHKYTIGCSIRFLRGLLQPFVAICRSYQTSLLSSTTSPRAFIRKMIFGFFSSTCLDGSKPDHWEQTTKREKSAKWFSETGHIKFPYIPCFRHVEIGFLSNPSNKTAL